MKKLFVTTATVVITALLSSPQAQQFGGRTVHGQCSHWQQATVRDREAFIDDLLTGYSMNTQRWVPDRQRAEAQACMRSLYVAPCATGAVTAREGLAMCLAMLGISR